MRKIRNLALTMLGALLLLAMARESVTLYMPLVSRMPTLTPTTTPTPTSTPTPTLTLFPGHYYLTGRVFFDYNGSGLQEEDEPGIAGVPVAVDSLTQQPRIRVSPYMPASTTRM